MPQYPIRIGLTLVLGMSVLGACGKSQSKKRAPETGDWPGNSATGDDWFNLDSTVGGINIDRVYADDVFENDVIVAVIDSGASVTHEDLKDHLWTNPSEIPDNAIDDDGNGYV
ncbi:MAG: hypothetical protein M3Q07_03115, partial [Pseudobdellovibrionaceae bacterium]|nr:hypothetical protein [Pseudobdellovibrionaceae bacterium]